MVVSEETVMSKEAVTEAATVKCEITTACAREMGSASHESRTKATAGESPKCVTTTAAKSVSSTSPAKSSTAAAPTTSAPVSKGSRGHHR